MMQWIIIAGAAMAVFSLFLAVMALKEKRSSARPPIHTCANQGGCRCSASNTTEIRPPASSPCRKPRQSA